MQALLRIHNLGWIDSKRLDKKGQVIPYSAQNGGGYTLEAELGIVPNGSRAPDYQGWEVKQYGVKSFASQASKALTLMTPEPDGGFYADKGLIYFMRHYGYEDANKKSRLNFTGSHYANQKHKKTHLTFVVEGFDVDDEKITDANGYIGLVDEQQNVVSSWSFAKIIQHWKRSTIKRFMCPQ